jgi:hypothetical protein
VSDGETVKVVVTTRAATGRPEAYRVLATASAGPQTRRVSFPAKAGRSGRLQFCIAGRATLTVGLVDGSGKWIGQPTEQRIIALR